jgi:hypothetical protein
MTHIKVKQFLTIQLNANLQKCRTIDTFSSVLCHTMTLHAFKQTIGHLKI